MAISYVGSRNLTSNGNSSSYLLTLFTDVAIQTGDVAITYVASATGTAGAAVFDGWTHIRTTWHSGGTQHRGSVWYRVVQSGDTTASSWRFDPPGTATGIAISTNVYRGVDTTTPIAADADFTVSDTSTALSNSVVNPSADCWKISTFMTTVTDDSSMSWSSSDAGTARANFAGTDATDNRALAAYDSNGTVATGSYTVTGTLDSTPELGDGRAWLGFLKSDAPPVTHQSVGILLG